MKISYLFPAKFQSAQKLGPNLRILVHISFISIINFKNRLIYAYFHTLLFFYKNTLYKNIEAQIWNFEMGFSENICASFKLVIKTNRGHHKKRFKHIIKGGSRLKMCKNWVQKLRTSKFSQFWSVLTKKKRV